MITQSESGLSAPDFAKLQGDDYDGNFRLVAERYNPLWQNVSVNGPSTGVFSACVHNNTVFRLTSSGLQTMTPSGISSVGAFTFKSGQPIDACVVSGNGALHVFGIWTDGIWWTYSTTGTSSFAAWAQVTTAPYPATQNIYYTAEIFLAFSSTTSGLAGGSTGAMLFDGDPLTTYRATTIAHTVEFNNTFKPTFYVLGFSITAQKWDAASQAGAAKHAPKRFALDMWIGGAWQEVALIKNQTGWKSGETRTFLFPTGISTALANFRVRFFKNNGGNELRVAEIDILERMGDLAFSYQRIDADVWNVPRVLYKDYTNNCSAVIQFGRSSNTAAWTVTGNNYITDQQVQDIAGSASRTVLLQRLPGVATKRTVDKVLKTYIYNAMGIGVENSTLHGLDMIDATEDWSLRYWTEINASVINGRYYLTAYETIKSDQGKDALTSTHLYSSADGLNWTRGERIQAPSNTTGKFTGACKILQLTHSGQSYIAFVWRDGVGYTKPVAMFPGTVDVTLQADMTNLLTEYSLDRDQFTSARGTFDDNEYTLGASSIIGQSIKTVLKHYFGFWDGTTRKDVLIATTDLDTFDKEEAAATSPSWKWSSRDIAFRLADKYQSLSFSETPNFQAYIDDFNVELGTEYAGLGHVYTDGSWEAAQDTSGYALVANGGSATASPATALFTFGESDLVNGVIYLKPTDFGSTPWNRIEIVFRAIDKDNFWSFRFNRTGTSQLSVTRNGSVTLFDAFGGNPNYGALATNIQNHGVWFRFYGPYVTIFVYDGTTFSGYAWPVDFTNSSYGYRVPDRKEQVVGDQPYVLIDYDYPSRGAVGVRFS